MRKKPTALICAAAVAALTFAAGALAAPIPVAIYTFATQGDVDAFTKGFGAKCKKKRTGAGQMSITVGPGTNHCQFRSSVVGSAGDTTPDVEVSGIAALPKNTPAKLQKKAFVGVNTRVSETAGWELRVRPLSKSWQLLRDPAGPQGAQVYRAGKGKFIRPFGKPNSVVLRTFDFGSPNTQVIAGINGKTVVTATDSATDQPDGRRNGVSAGVKGSAPGPGVTGIFDDIAIRVPDPFE